MRRQMWLEINLFRCKAIVSAHLTALTEWRSMCGELQHSHSVPATSGEAEFIELRPL